MTNDVEHLSMFLLVICVSFFMMCLLKSSASPTFLFLNLKKYILIYFWLSWVFVAACGLSLVVVSGSYSLDAVHGLLTGVVSLVA